MSIPVIRQRWLFAVSAALALGGLCLVVGLGRSTPATTPSVATVTVPSAADDQPASATTPTLMKASRPWRIAFIPKFKLLGATGSLSLYWQRAWEGAQAAGAACGVSVRLVTSDVQGRTDADYVEPQIRLIADLIAKKDIDGLVVAAFDSNRLAPVIDRADAAGIPTIALDTPINSRNVLTLVYLDNVAAGRKMGLWVGQRLGGHGKAILLDGPQDEQNAVDRRNGFIVGLQDGGIDILTTRSADWEVAPAHQQVAQLLREFHDVDAILAANDNMALGTADAVTEAGRTGIVITGFDATDAGLAALKAGRIAATIDQRPDAQAALAVALMVRHLETHEAFPATETVGGIRLVTADAAALAPTDQTATRAGP